MLDLVVEGNAYLEGRLNKCCIGIENGKIVALKKILKGDKHLDFGDKCILPAGIDVHVHFRDPGQTHKEDFGTGTMAAAFGGIGTVLDMPNTQPSVDSKETVLKKLEKINKKAYIDFGLYSSVSRRTQIPATAEVCTAFKIYLATTTGKLLFSNDKLLPSVLSKINKSEQIPAIHAEDGSIIRQNLNLDRPIKDLHNYLRARPNKAEARAVARLIKIAKQWDTKIRNNKQLKGENLKKHIHICHVSAAETIKLIRKFRRFQTYNADTYTIDNLNSTINLKPDISKDPNDLQKLHNTPGLTIPDNLSNNNNNHNNHKKHNFTFLTLEVTPHHLLLNEKSINGGLGKVNPPLRTTKDQMALWSALADGTIDILASDHAPHTLDEKSEEFAYAPAGLPGVETMLPLMLSHVKHKRLAFDRLASAVTSNPGEIFKLPKGKLAVGYDGDLIVVDFYKEEQIKTEELHSKCGWTPYEKMDAIFPILTVVRGNIIVKDRNLEADQGTGIYYH